MLLNNWSAQKPKRLSPLLALKLDRIPSNVLFLTKGAFLKNLLILAVDLKHFVSEQSNYGIRHFKEAMQVWQQNLMFL